MYECKVCGRPVHATDSGLNRTCGHVSAPVVAPMSAVLYGISAVNRGVPEALALMDTTPKKAG